ncbi:MAG: COP23 domain-containing protein [Oscillatoria sp. PMC 1050.18]|nr:COP23 domain-containing protein [Oscillatoria sp. PMC 1050.18]
MKMRTVTSQMTKITTPALLASIILSGIVACSQQTNLPPTEEPVNTELADTNTETTIFNCVQQQGSWATIVQRGNVSSSPIISWQTVEFGEKWTPEKRCQHVSEKLTQAVKNNGGELTNLELTYGDVDGYTVICLVKSQESCNSANQLFTLNEQNRANPALALKKLDNFAQGKAGESTVEKSDDLPEFVSLEALVDASFQVSEGG